MVEASASQTYFSSSLNYPHYSVHPLEFYSYKKHHAAFAKLTQNTQGWEPLEGWCVWHWSTHCQQNNTDCITALPVSLPILIAVKDCKVNLHLQVHMRGIWSWWCQYRLTDPVRCTFVHDTNQSRNGGGNVLQGSTKEPNKLEKKRVYGSLYTMEWASYTIPELEEKDDLSSIGIVEVTARGRARIDLADLCWRSGDGVGVVVPGWTSNCGYCGLVHWGGLSRERVRKYSRHVWPMTNLQGKKRKRYIAALSIFN